MKLNTTQTICDEDGLRLRLMYGGSTTLVVSFSGIGLAATTQQVDEFSGTASQYGRNPVLFVADCDRSWFSNPEHIPRIVAVVEDLRARRTIERIVTVGNSMGGFGALLLPAFMRIDAAFGIAPQLTMRRSAVDEYRWPEWHEKLDETLLHDLRDHIDPDTRYFAVHGREGPDILHWSRFPEAPNVTHVLMDRMTHHVARELKDEGLLAPAVNAAIAGDVDGFLALLEPAGGKPRRPGESERTSPNRWFKSRQAQQAAQQAAVG